jgi:hypothetical protein
MDSYPLDNSYVRGFNNPGSGWFFKSHEGGTVMTYIIHCDLKGWFLPFIINKAIAGTFATFFVGLRKALEDDGLK